MRRTAMAGLVLALACGLVSAKAFGFGGTCCMAKGAKTGSACTGVCSKTSEFPSMKIMVGDKEFHCPVEAGEVAKKSDTKVVYMVSDDKFDDQGKAMVAYADECDEFIGKFTTIACVVDGKVMYCSEKGGNMSCCSAKGEKTASAGCAAHGDKADTTKVADAGSKSEAHTCTGHKDSDTTKVADHGTHAGHDKDGETKTASAGSSCCKAGAAKTGTMTAECCKNMKNAKFMVAGRMFEKYDDAVKARDAVLAAIKPIKMTYVVDGKSIESSDEVCPMAKKAGKVEYVINKDKTNCEYHARVMMAKAKYDAAKDATEKAVAKI